MNLGIVTSFIIAAILMIAIVAMNINIAQSSGELTLRQITQQNVTATADLIAHDIPKIGFAQMGGISNAITYADSTMIAFICDIDFNGDLETVVWLYDTTDPVEAGSNPDDYVLKRGVVDGTGTSAGAIKSDLQDGSIATATNITFGVTDFDFTYYDKDRISIPTPVSDYSKIVQVKVEFTIESKEKYGNSGQYTQSVWTKTFTPKNIE